ncbi:MAG: tetratricopeptide repeat protein [Gemmatimonadetes bacterium]|nr:tetratricopeptide repeat protein [Gemmatimonadota bacterium]
MIELSSEEPLVAMERTPVLGVRDLLRLGLVAHQAGDLRGAMVRYRQVLAREPNQPDALNLVGVLAHQCGDHPLAIALLERAVELDPRAPDFPINLGLAYRAHGNVPRARAEFERAVALRPASAKACLHLGNALRLQGDALGALRACADSPAARAVASCFRS